MELPFSECLQARSRSFDSVDAFWRWHARNDRFSRPVDRAIAGGGGADRLGFAFVAGYAAALHAMFPAFGPRTLASLAATEDQGAHPKFIQTALSSADGGFVLSGKKSWVTLAGEELLVLAKAGELNGRADLRVVRVSRSLPGVRVVPLPPAPFVPEVLHAEVHFDGVKLPPAAVLEGDGWVSWVKPFRTVEDIHVHAALAGHLLGSATRFGWPNELREKLIATGMALRELAAQEMSDPVVHLALAGVIDQSRALVREIEPLWDKAPAEVRERWSRDGALLKVAGKAREARRQKAWETLREEKSS